MTPMKLNVKVVNLDAQNHGFGDHTAGQPYNIISLSSVITTATPAFLVSRLDTEHLLHMGSNSNLAFLIGSYHTYHTYI